MSAMERFAIVARLKPGLKLKAAELLTEGPPFDPRSTGLDSHAVYLAQDAVVFVFEGREAGSVLSEIVDDPFRSPVFEAWVELLDGRPEIAREAYRWDSQADPD